ncbi:SAG family member [Eimeria brunetti]|uniref:SAG family member n=1 Tax=Eimeria brunetti TaxID=51314 RepID=U6LKT3_9EIME|nr:SAG family member [Eimeria brunetti]
MTWRLNSACTPALSRSQGEAGLPVLHLGSRIGRAGPISAPSGGQYPAEFTDGGGAYDEPNAVGLVSLLSEHPQTIYCGTPDVCQAGTLICYFRPAGIQEGVHPVTAEMWHKVEESFNLKPKLEPHDEGHKDSLEAVNAVRTIDGLNLPEFTAPTASEKTRRNAGSGTPIPAYEEALYNLKCEQIKDSTIDPTIADKYTLIYAIKPGKVAPTAQEAVDFWKTGFLKLGTAVPPPFPAKDHNRSDEIDGTIYNDNAVAGFVSLMVDTPREMRCYNATGCDNAALICFLSGPTLVESSQPISEDTWQKILALYSAEVGEGDKEIKFTKRDEEEDCLTEINEFRTQDSLGLEAFTAEGSTSTEEPKNTTESVKILAGLTCDSLKTGSATILDTESNSSLMYYYGTSATCSEAVSAWKKGYEKFSDVTIPPEYTSEEELYKTGAATNFISLVSEGTKTTATCYTVTGCTEEGLVCVLKPAIFAEGGSPITEGTWTKVTEALNNGASAASVYGALLSSLFVAFGLFVLSF